MERGRHMELILDRITKQYKNKIAVDRISLTMQKGIYGLLGANGAGKTMLMRMICGILRPDSGEIFYDGMHVGEEGYRNMLGYLPQEFGYYPEFTAADFLLYLAALKGIPRRRAKEKAAGLLESVGLGSVASKKVKAFSGGMRQRLGIAQALLNNPRILILDEPTAGLDPKERVKFRNLISELGKERIVLLSTHIVSDVEHIADVILVMKDGAIKHQGSLGQIIQAVEGKVWECRADEPLAKALAEKYPVLNIRKEDGGACLRMVCPQKPLQSAWNAEATLEDLYLYYFREQ